MNAKNNLNVLKNLSMLLVLITFVGCATTKEEALQTKMTDPYENINRKIYKFNETLDKYALKPVAKQYAKLPSPVKIGVENIFDNLQEPSNAVNNTLQGKYQDAWYSAFRFVINSTFGLAGTFDLLEKVGMEEKREDFGQTLAHYGVAPGPYVILPFLGPSTLRSTANIPVEIGLSPLTYILDEDLWIEALIYSVDLVDTRASLLSYEKQLELQLDPYSTVRNLYYQNRRKVIYDGEIPNQGDEFDDEFDEAFEDEDFE